MYHQALSRRKINQRVHFFTSPAAKNTASQQKERHVGSEARCHLEARRGVQAVASESLKPHERGSGVTTPSAQSAAGRNALFESGSDPSLEFPRLAPQLAGAVNQVVAACGNRRVPAIKHNAGLAGERELQPVVQRNCMVYGPDFMIAVRTAK